ncbi:Substance-K receptor [Trichoplax sp. H2]|nr:Substance-K receptor [Trichoplax sp. H2]|eukprot:RDD38204.1 Substance-K receptor [Trichoplax sp. H2]
MKVMFNESNQNDTTHVWYHIPYSVALYFLCSLGILFNLTVCLVIFTKQYLQQPLNRLIANVALSDLTHSLSICLKYTFPIVISTYPQAFHGLTVTSVNTVCRFLNFFAAASMSNSLLSLAFIGQERCHTILHPFKSPYRNRKIVANLLFSWSISIGGSFLIVFATNFEENKIVDCTGIYSKGSSFTSAICTIIFAIISCIIPLLIITVCYTMIIAKLCVRKIPVNESSYKVKIRKMIQKKKLSITALLSSTILSAISTGPFIILYAFMTYHKVIDPRFYLFYPSRFWIFFQMFPLIMIQPCVFNPILYYFASPTFKEEIKRLLASIGIISYRPKIRLSNKKSTSSTH